jgi:hypothetical protein
MQVVKRHDTGQVGAYQLHDVAGTNLAVQSKRKGHQHDCTSHPMPDVQSALEPFQSAESGAISDRHCQKHGLPVLEAEL